MLHSAPRSLKTPRRLENFTERCGLPGTSYCRRLHLEKSSSSHKHPRLEARKKKKKKKGLCVFFLHLARVYITLFLLYSGCMSEPFSACVFQGILSDSLSRHKQWNKLNQRSREPYLRMQPWLNGDQGQNAHIQQAQNQGKQITCTRTHQHTEFMDSSQPNSLG